MWKGIKEVFRWHQLPTLSAYRSVPSLFSSSFISVRQNSNRAAVTRINRNLYPKMYTTLLVFTDGSTIDIRYKEPRSIIKLPIDLSSLTEKERAERIAKRRPKKKAIQEEDIEDSFDVNQYSHLWKKK